MTMELPPKEDSWWTEAGDALLAEIRKLPMTLLEAQAKTHRPFGCKLPAIDLARALLDHLVAGCFIEKVQRERNYGPAVWCIPGTHVEGAIGPAPSSGQLVAKVQSIKERMKRISRPTPKPKAEPEVSTINPDSEKPAPEPEPDKAIDITSEGEPMAKDEDWISTTEAAGIMGISRERVSFFAREGMVLKRGGGTGNKLEVLRADVERLKDKRARGAVKPKAQAKKAKPKAAKPRNSTFAEVAAKHAAKPRTEIIVARAVPTGVSDRDRILWCIQGARIGQMSDQEALERIASMVEGARG